MTQYVEDTIIQVRLQTMLVPRLLVEGVLGIGVVHLGREVV